MNCRDALPLDMRTDALFCSEACRLRWRRMVKKFFEAGHRRWHPRLAQKRRCKHCGGFLDERVYTPHRQRKDAMYCKPACRQAAYRQRALSR